MPSGNILMTKNGYAILVQPFGLLQISLHFSGSAHATSSVRKFMQELMVNVDLHINVKLYKTLYLKTFTWIQYSAYHSWYYKEEKGEDLKIACNDTASFAVKYRFCGQIPLHYCLQQRRKPL